MCDQALNGVNGFDELQIDALDGSKRCRASRAVKYEAGVTRGVEGRAQVEECRD